MDTHDPSAPSLPESFLAGGEETHALVRGWVETVVGCGSWRFFDPEGVVQEVLLKLVAIVEDRRFRGASSFRTFVTSVARHSCIDIYRRERFRAGFESDLAVEDVDPSATGNPERALRSRERVERLLYIFQNLPEECRRLWRMLYGDQLAPAEIAARLGISGGTARVRVHRCLEKAREIGRRFVAAPMSGT